jgi:hypothetical protein
VSDQQTLEAILDRAGIVRTIAESIGRAEDAAMVLEIEAGTGPKNLGHGYFVSRLGLTRMAASELGCWK